MKLASAIYRAHQAIDAARQERLAQLDMTPRQYQLLEFFADHPRCSQTMAVIGTGIDRSTLADITRRLTERRLVGRKRSKADARAYCVEVTDAGTTALKTARDLVDDADAAIAAGLSHAEVSRLTSMLTKIIHRPSIEAAA